jgi:hypothetical protein
MAVSLVPTWGAAVKIVLLLRMALAAGPASILVLFFGLTILLALFLDVGRRTYALELADRLIKLASVLIDSKVGAPAERSLSAPGAATSALTQRWI